MEASNIMIEDKRMKQRDIEILSQKSSSHQQTLSKEAAETNEMKAAIAQLNAIQGEMQNLQSLFCYTTACVNDACIISCLDVSESIIHPSYCIGLSANIAFRVLVNAVELAWEWATLQALRPTSSAAALPTASLFVARHSARPESLTMSLSTSTLVSLLQRLVLETEMDGYGMI